jgi:hypothetical protein
MDTLSRENVLVTAKPHPASKARRTIGHEVAGGAEARPKGFGNLQSIRIFSNTYNNKIGTYIIQTTSLHLMKLFQ